MEQQHNHNHDQLDDRHQNQPIEDLRHQCQHSSHQHHHQHPSLFGSSFVIINIIFIINKVMNKNHPALLYGYSHQHPRHRRPYYQLYLWFIRTWPSNAQPRDQIP